MAALALILFFSLLPAMPGGDFSAPGSNCVPVRISADSLAYKAGEKLDFTLHYKFGMIDSDVGSATVTLDSLTCDGESAFHCRVYGKTTRFYDWFFKVREDFNSWFRRSDLQPLRFTRETSEGKYRASDSYVYRWDAPEPYIDAEVFTSSFGNRRHFDIPLKPCTFDLPALFFYARNIDMSRVCTDFRHPMTFAIDEDVYDVYFIYKGRQTCKVKGIGTVRCLKFAAKLLEGSVFNGDADLDIYISDDGNRLPVLFGAPIRVGEVEGRLVSWSGLAHPFSSLIEK